MSGAQRGDAFAAHLGAAEAARRIARGELSAQALAEACVARATAREPQLHAWAHLSPDAVIAQARALDAQTTPKGVLHGVPVAVKDILDTADMPSRYGSPIYAQHQPLADASCVAQSRAAGALVMGKTHTTEFANIHPAATANPHRVGHTPGGSSSGSAAAVADFQVPLAFATQTAGSTIRPAAFCGVVGYKPSFNRINRAGLKFSSESLDTIGLLARHVEDVSLWAHALIGQAPAALPTVPLRVGLHRTTLWGQASDSAQQALLDAAQRLKAAGASVSDVTLDGDFTILYEAQGVVMRYEAARATAWEMAHRRSLLSRDLWLRLEQGMATPHSQYLEALALAQRCSAQLVERWQSCDVLLSLSAPGEAPEGLHSTGDSVFNRNWTLLGLPCVHLCGLVGRVGVGPALSLARPPALNANGLTAGLGCEWRPSTRGFPRPQTGRGW
jgi:Asp-tRNA(Asn)/Glu-tRNA(Gln) amidotransferase A subunit family amidase